MSSVSTISHEERPLPQCVSTTLEWRHDYTWMSSYNPLVHFVFLLLPLLCYPNNLVTTHTWMISIQTPCDFLFFFLSLSFFFLFSSLVPALLSEPVLLLELVPTRFVLQRSRREFFLRLLRQEMIVVTLYRQIDTSVVRLETYNFIKAGTPWRRSRQLITVAPLLCKTSKIGPLQDLVTWPTHR